MRGSKPERGYFREIREIREFPGPTLGFDSKLREELLEKVKRYNEKVHAQGPVKGCGCSRCLDARKTEFIDLYGEKT